MRKRVIAAILAGMLIVSAGGCGKGAVSSGNVVDNSDASESSLNVVAEDTETSVGQEKNADSKNSSIAGLNDTAGTGEDADTQNAGVTALSLMQQVNTGDEQIIDDNYRTWYEVFVYSFFDSDGDGIGDLKGMIEKLDYLQELGINAVWMSPVFASPNVDNGYDISDYYKIAEQFGTMDDFDTLVAEMKKRGMHLIMDLVVNHCSDKHEWFQKALADPDGPYAGYFYFREGKDGKAPSNYRSYFGGSAWTKVPGTNKYYLHTFAKEQPDLNWENPVVRKKIYEMINWWFEKGISGFRIDAIINIKKNLDFPSFPADGDDGLVSCDKMLASAHGIGTFLEEMKHETFDKYDAFTVGEVFHLKEDELREFIGEDGHFSTKFDFSAHVLSYGEHGWYDAPALDFNRWRTALFDTQKADLTVGFEANIIENHDEPRGATHYLPAHARNEAGVKMLAATYFLLRGIPFIYQGQEIGMTNCVRNDISEYDDISTKDQYQAALNAGCSKEAALHACYENSRDNARIVSSKAFSPI